MVRQTQTGLIFLVEHIRWSFGFTIVFTILTCVFTLSSCENDLETIQRVTYDPKAPDEVIKNLRVFYNDSGCAKIEINAKIAESYSKPETVTKLRDGLKVNFFSPQGQVVSTLTALYGEVNFSKGTMYVRDSVQLFNYSNKQRLLTESLHWNQKDSLIYTHSNVVVRSPGSILYGDGIETKQDFSQYVFLKPRGTYNFDKD